MAKKSFTIEQANKTIPFVKLVVKDIMDKYERLEGKRRDYERAKRREESTGTDADHDHVEQLEEETRVLAEEITTHIQELEQVGCQLKDFRTGLLDYPAELEGRTILLCWLYGEDDILFWHEVDAGFSGRQPIETLYTGARDDES